MTTYNHMMTIAFTVSGSKCPTGETLKPAELRNALLRRIAELDSQNMWEEAIGMPDDTYEEDKALTLHYGVTSEGAAVELGNYASADDITDRKGCVLVLNPWAAGNAVERMEQLLLNPEHDAGRCFAILGERIFEHNTKYLVSSLHAELDRIDGPVVFVSEAMLQRIASNLRIALSA